MRRKSAPLPEPPKIGRGRPPATEQVKVYPGSRKGDMLRFDFAENVVVKLIELRDREYPSMPYITPDHRFKFLRIQFARFAEIGMPATFVRLEPPIYDPRHDASRALVRVSRGRRFETQIRASMIGMRSDLETMHLTLLWADLPNQRMQGLVLIFPDEALLYTGPKTSISQEDLLVRS